MIPCPNCGNQEYHVSRQCPKHNGAPVCIRCCTECAYYNPDPVGIACRYRAENPRTDYRGEIYKLSRQAETKEKQIAYFYKNNKPWIAEKIEAELTWLRHDRAELERKQRDE